MPQKHLVLDYDVHLRLMKRKAATGFSIRDIGNLILRETLSQPHLLVDVVGEKLVDLGLLTPEVYNQAVDQAVKEINQRAVNCQELVSSGEDGTLIAGSWRLLSIHRSEDDTFQIVEARTKDARKKSIPPHIHDEDEYFHVLEGRVLVTDEGQQVILGPESCYRILRGHAHTATPLDGSVYAMITFIPAGPLFSEKARLSDGPKSSG